jgi:hypothetical protein
VEQGGADLRLEATDRLRQRRLGDVEALGGSSEVALLGDGDERTQVTKFDGGLPIVSSKAINRDGISLAVGQVRA